MGKIRANIVRLEIVNNTNKRGQLQHMGKAFLIYLKWTSLNVGLPALAALLTYWFAYLHNSNRSADDILITAFSSGDNLIVASIIFVVLYFEVDAVIANGEVKLLPEFMKFAAILMCLLFAILFGAFKFYSFARFPQDILLHRAGALLSISALSLSCVCAGLGKFALIAADWRQISNGH